MYPAGIDTFDMCVHPPNNADVLFLFDFLFQPVKFLRAEKLSERDAQTVTQTFDRYQLGILALSVKDVLHGGRRQRRQRCRFI